MPPINVEELARRLDVVLSDRQGLIEDGRLEVSDADIEIHVRNGLSRTRRRFTIAHELGHLILPCPGTRTTARRSSWDHSDEERLCDEIAAAILMPREWIRHRFLHRAHNLSTVRHLAYQADVSMAAALVRLKELVGWSESLLRWRYEEGKWRFIAGAGVPRSIHGDVRSAPCTSGCLDRLKITSRDKDADLPLLVRGKMIETLAQISVMGTSAVALVTLPSE
jgi:hypothetical protein